MCERKASDGSLAGCGGGQEAFWRLDVHTPVPGETTRPGCL